MTDPLLLGSRAGFTGEHFQRCAKNDLCDLIDSRWRQPGRPGPLPTIELWGPQLIQIYNDAYRPILGERHPAALGQPTRACWPQGWAFNEPIYRRGQDGGERVHFKGLEFVIELSGVPQARFFTITCTPARDESGQIAGATVIATDTTQRVRVERARGDARLEQGRMNAQLVGNELARQFRAHSDTADAILIAVTGYGQEQDRKNSLAAGFDDHMVKPLDFNQLEALLIAVVQR